MGVFWGVLERLGASWGASWGRLGVVMGAFWGVLERLGACWGASWGRVERFGGVLGQIIVANGSYIEAFHLGCSFQSIFGRFLLLKIDPRTLKNHDFSLEK